ncbi:MAG: hypothetical protein RR632_00005 [Christensenella sp.]
MAAYLKDMQSFFIEEDLNRKGLSRPRAKGIPKILLYLNPSALQDGFLYSYHF